MATAKLPNTEPDHIDQKIRIGDYLGGGLKEVSIHRDTIGNCRSENPSYSLERNNRNFR
jgi:hypothetical protein